MIPPATPRLNIAGAYKAEVARYGHAVVSSATIAGSAFRRCWPTHSHVFLTSPPRLSICRFHVAVTVGDAFQDPVRWLDLGLGRLEDRAFEGVCPNRERRAEWLVVGVFGGDSLALPFGQLVGEFAVPGRQLYCLPRHVLDVRAGS